MFVISAVNSTEMLYSGKIKINFILWATNVRIIWCHLNKNSDAIFSIQWIRKHCTLSLYSLLFEQWMMWVMKILIKNNNKCVLTPLSTVYIFHFEYLILIFSIQHMENRRNGLEDEFYYLGTNMLCILHTFVTLNTARFVLQWADNGRQWPYIIRRSPTILYAFNGHSFHFMIVTL